MRVDLAVPYRDTCAADLLVAVRAGGEAPDGLSVLTAHAGGFALELRILGASHAVVATAGDGRALTEVVACGARSGVPLGGATQVVGSVRHVFEARTEPLGAHADRVRALAADPSALVACFPGAPDALTAVRALPHGGWSTWHLYPSTGEAVLTRTTLEPVA